MSATYVIMKLFITKDYIEQNELRHTVAKLA